MAGSMPTDIVERVLQCNKDANRGKKKVVPAPTQPPTQALPTPMNPYAGWPMPPWAPPPYQAALHQAALQPPTLPLAAVATARGSSPPTITQLEAMDELDYVRMYLEWLGVKYPAVQEVVDKAVEPLREQH
ncbi:unnamed protein product [Zymoseptoria tritici ST99CH_1E4]|uniref:Uncharacterized protein n=1 Tax=Zymoseptoria tritici ST99CH_1E4 TaxID=1276532 RepID=A0A2H1H9G0_ZYMTR|nr:unnamed protein product [Zymoseptoria tritici ST99CH_1E4]